MKDGHVGAKTIEKCSSVFFIIIIESNSQKTFSLFFFPPTCNMFPVMSGAIKESEDTRRKRRITPDVTTGRLSFLC